MIYVAILLAIAAVLVFSNEKKEKEEQLKKELLKGFFDELRYYDEEIAARFDDGPRGTTVELINNRLSVIAKSLSKFYPGFTAPKLA
jgi:hypothetical protein